MEPGSSGGEPVADPDLDRVLVRQLRQLAKTGLVVAQVRRREVERGDLGQLLALVTREGDALETRVTSLVEQVVQACRALSHLREGRAAMALYGLAGDMSASFRRRREVAREEWDTGIEVETFVRLYERVVLEAVLIRLRGTKPPTLAPVAQRPLPPLPAEIDRNTNALDPRWFHAETVIGRAEREAYYTVWKRDFLALRSGMTDWLMRATYDADTIVVPLNGTATIAGPYGADQNGRAVWRFVLPKPTKAGETIHIEYRKEYSGKSTQLPTSQYLSLASRSEHPYERGQFVADFSRCSEKPIEAVRFVTPIGSLPHLEDRAWPIKLQVKELVADFDLFVPRHSHGIYWWFEQDQYFRDMRRPG